MQHLLHTLFNVHNISEPSSSISKSPYHKKQPPLHLKRGDISTVPQRGGYPRSKRSHCLFLPAEDWLAGQLSPSVALLSHHIALVAEGSDHCTDSVPLLIHNTLCGIVAAEQLRFNGSCGFIHHAQGSQVTFRQRI